MSRRAVPVWLLLTAMLVVAATGCGGGSASAYTPDKTRSCLISKGVSIGGKLDFVASTATGGAFAARLSDNSVKVVFGETVDDARQIQHAYERFAFPNVKAGLPDVLHRYGNAITLWQEHPQDADLSLVVNCLK